MTNHERPTGDNEIRGETFHTEERTGREVTHETSDDTKYFLPTVYRGRVAWGSIFAGTIVALVVMSVLNLLGIAVGAIAIDSGAGADGVGIGAGIWWTVSALIALFIGGWTAGHFSHAQERSDGLMHGVVTWALFVLASFLAVTTAVGQFLGGAFGLIGQNISTALTAMQPEGGIQSILAQAGVEQGEMAEAEATMTAAGEQAMEALAIGAGWAFVALLLGVLCCALGGSFGVIEPDERQRARGKRFSSRLRPSTT